MRYTERGESILPFWEGERTDMIFLAMKYLE